MIWNKNKQDKQYSLNDVELEKGDVSAIIIAALTTILPVVLFVILIFALVTKLFFRI